MTHRLGARERAASAILPFLTLVAAFAMVPGAGFAYVGPGAGLTAIGTVIAFIAALALAVTGFVWYPVKRLLARSSRSRDTGQEHKGK